MRQKRAFPLYLEADFVGLGFSLASKPPLAVSA